MIYLELFITFLLIGAISFGGGYGMISIIRETILTKNWLTENQFLNFIAICESTPGPIAVNMATFIGFEKGGITGSLLATIGVILPSFIIILIVATILKKVFNNPIINAIIQGIKPCIIALILSTALIMLLKNFFDFSTFKDSFSINYKEICIFFILVIIGSIYKKISKKTISPILMIITSAILGIVFFAL